MERLVRIAKKLRTEHNFNGYIHLKTIPGASDEIIYEAGLWADRLSVNIELPSDASLKKIAPEKSFEAAFKPMEFLKNALILNKSELVSFKNTPKLAPAGQSTQLIVGASPESDQEILKLSEDLYQNKRLKRVYFSGYIPISTDSRLPTLEKAPLVRENRLYQADWLMRFYGFKAAELLDETHPNLDANIDPKAMWSLRHLDEFPVDINHAPYYKLIRVPGIGLRSAERIVKARKFGLLREDQLIKIGVVWKRARYFVTCAGHIKPLYESTSENLKQNLLSDNTPVKTSQLSIF